MKKVITYGTGNDAINFLEQLRLEQEKDNIPVNNYVSLNKAKTSGILKSVKKEEKFEKGHIITSTNTSSLDEFTKIKGENWKHVYEILLNKSA